MRPCPPEVVRRGTLEGAAHYNKHTRIKETLYTERYPTDVWEFASGNGNREGHRTAKPLALLIRMIQTWSNPGDLILDPGIGRGGTLRAAKTLERRAIGIDMREECCERAARWLEQEVLVLGG